MGSRKLSRLIQKAGYSPFLLHRSLTNSNCDVISANQLTADSKIIQVENPEIKTSKILHAVNRLSFGAAPGDIEKVREIGIDKYIQQQLTPGSIPEPQSLKNKLSQLQTLRLTPAQLSASRNFLCFEFSCSGK